MDKFWSGKETTLDIIVPVLNGGKFLRDALKSIENQLSQPERVILIDNCSTDNTAEIMKRWATNKKNVDVYQNRRLLSFADNWNYGLELASSEYVHFLAHDDTIHPKFVQTFKKIAKKHAQADAFAFRVCTIDESGNTQFNKFSLPFEYTLDSKRQLEKSITVNPYNLAGGVFKRERMVNLNFMNRDYSIWSDWVLWQNILMSGTIVRSLRVATNYRIHSDFEKKNERKDLVAKDLGMLIHYQLPLIFEHLKVDTDKRAKLISSLQSNVLFHSSI